MLSIRRNYVRSQRRGIEKDTKTHQMRRITSLDPDTVAVLAEHRQRYEERARPQRSPSSRAVRRSSRPPEYTDLACG